MGDIFATQHVNMREIRCFSFISNLFISSERVKWPSLKRYHRWTSNRLHKTILFVIHLL